MRAGMLDVLSRESRTLSLSLSLLAAMAGLELFIPKLLRFVAGAASSGWHHPNQKQDAAPLFRVTPAIKFHKEDEQRMIIGSSNRSRR